MHVQKWVSLYHKRSNYSQNTTTPKILKFPNIDTSQQRTTYKDASDK